MEGEVIEKRSGISERCVKTHLSLSKSRFSKSEMHTESLAGSLSLFILSASFS